VQRRLFNLAAAVSLLMMFGVIALWVRSADTMDNVVWRASESPLLLGGSSNGGRLCVMQFAPIQFDVPRGVRWTSEPMVKDPFPHTICGFGFFRLSFRSLGFPHPDLAGRNFIMIQVPHWFAAGSCATLPALVPLRWWPRRRRQRLGLCNVCGYDLRATPDRCPECGTAVAPKPAEAAA